MPPRRRTDKRRADVGDVEAARMRVSARSLRRLAGFIERGLFDGDADACRAKADELDAQADARDPDGAGLSPWPVIQRYWLTEGRRRNEQ